MEIRAQISFEYLLTVTFALVLVLAAIVIAMNLGSLSQTAKTRILEAREETISSIMG
jgi:uncharacterized protein (UPF0333 family)